MSGPVCQVPGVGGQTHRAPLRSQPPPCKAGEGGRDHPGTDTLSLATPTLDTVAASTCALSLLAEEGGLKGEASEPGFMMGRWHLPVKGQRDSEFRCLHEASSYRDPQAASWR